MIEELAPYHCITWKWKGTRNKRWTRIYGCECEGGAGGPRSRSMSESSLKTDVLSRGGAIFDQSWRLL